MKQEDIDVLGSTVSKMISPGEPGSVPKVKKDISVLRAEDYDNSISSSYSICDAKIPVIGSACDNLTTSTGLRKILMYVIAIPLLGFVVFMDIFGDWITIVMTFLADALDGVPIAGTIVGILESGEFDDIIDVISWVIVFYFCGPVSLVGIPEFIEGFIEIFPFWTMILIVWFVFIRPARERYLARKESYFASLAKP